MAARSETGRDHFDLLPFISVMICTLACLLFVTLSVAALALGNPGEIWDPVVGQGSAAKNKTPVLIEWDGETAIARLGQQEVVGGWQEPTRYQLGDDTFYAAAQPTPEFKRILSHLYDRRKTHFAVLAIRPSGFGTFWQFTQEFRTRGIGVGYEPIEQDRKVRLAPSVPPAPRQAGKGED